VKPVVIIAIAVGVSVVAVLGVLIGIGAYQQALLEEQQRKEAQALIELLKMVFESQKEQSTTPQPTPQPAKSTPPLPPQDCSGSARCIPGYVTEIIDGDTIKVDGQSIRFALANAYEMTDEEGIAARGFVVSICPVGSSVLVDEDDGQTQGSYGRILAVIYCNGINLNEAVLDEGHAIIDKRFCDDSEFSSEEWAKKYGCTQTIQMKENKQTSQPPASVPPIETKENSCDPSYPDVCIPPSPPDLDCGEIPYRNFKVLPPDPHRFDGDKDGIGCEE